MQPITIKINANLPWLRSKLILLRLKNTSNELHEFVLFYSGGSKAAKFYLYTVVSEADSPMGRLWVTFSKVVRINLIVLSIGLSLGIKDAGPVVGFEVEFGVNIHLYINALSGLLDGVCGDTRGSEGSTNEPSNSGWAPSSNNLSSLQGELGSKDRVLNGVTIYLTERKRLVDRGAFVTKGVDGSLGVNGNADGKTTSNTRSGRSWGWKIVNRDAWHVHKLGGVFGHGKSSAGGLMKKTKSVR